MNRIEEGRCPKCGFELLDLSKSFCSSCQKEIIKEVAARVASRKTVTRKRMKLKIGMLSKRA
jgi:predicted RNA-binding Zn-ribbon protein involved in translation (DUF1610 family)